MKERRKEGRLRKEQKKVKGGRKKGRKEGEGRKEGRKEWIVTGRRIKERTKAIGK